MENQRRDALGRLWKVLTFVGVLIVCLAIRFDFYYDLNDDTAIRDILSGRYTGEPSGYCIQMLYPLGWLIAAAYRAIRKVSWYGLFLCLCQFGSLALIAWRLTSLAGKKWIQIGLLVLEGILVLGLAGRELVIVQYSVTSGLCMAGALFWYLTVEDCTRPIQYLRANLVPVLLILLSFMIRTEMCFMLLPFVLLAGLGCWSRESKPFSGVNVRKYLLLIGSALLGMLVLYSLDSFAYRSQEWKSFRKCFDARTQLYDFYGIPDYEENKDFYDYIGLSRESYMLLQNYNFALDDSIDEKMLERIAMYQEQRAKNGEALYYLGGFVCRNSPKQALWRYREQLLSLDGSMGILLAAYLLYLLLAASGKRSGCYWKVALLVLIRSVLWLYLYMVDRVLDRVVTPLITMEFILLAGWIIQEIRFMSESQSDTVGSSKFYHMKIAGVLALLSACGLACAVINMENTGKEYELRQEADIRWQALTDYCKAHPDCYYSIDVYSSTSYNGTPYSDKLFHNKSNSYCNYDICGGWIAKSPLMRKKLEVAGLKGLEEALMSGDAFFIAKTDSDVSWMMDYYNSRGRNIRLTAVDEIKIPDGTEVYKVYQLQ